jgi:hypothetical protein
VRKGAYFLLAAIALIIVTGCYMYTEKRHAPHGVWLRIKSLDEIKTIYKNGKVRTITRSEDMRKAMGMISNVFRSAQQRSIERRTDTEVRFYPSTRAKVPGTYTAGDMVFDSLQAFQINADTTRSPLEEPSHLPGNIVFYADACADMQIDEKKDLMWVTMGPDFFAHIVLYDLHSWRQVPVDDRSITIFDDAIYDATDDNLPADLKVLSPIPDWRALPSFPVHP